MRDRSASVRHRVLVVERHAGVERLPADRAVHRAAVDVPVAELAGDRAGDGPFPAPDGPSMAMMSCDMAT